MTRGWTRPYTTSVYGGPDGESSPFFHLLETGTSVSRDYFTLDTGVRGRVSRSRQFNECCRFRHCLQPRDLRELN